jgi:hypothetical protein
MMVAIGSALGSDYSEQWVESMTETPMQREMLKLATQRAKASTNSAMGSFNGASING